MINFNGRLQSSQDNILEKNRAFLYGDGVFETFKVRNNRVLFLEDHYFRLMSSMRILRMEIPMNFTMEFLEDQILETTSANNCSYLARARITIYRQDGGKYLPKTNEIFFLISTNSLNHFDYIIEKKTYEIELYKDFFVSANLLSTLKTTSKTIAILGSIFAKENGFDNCLLLNDSKNVVESLNSNIFMVIDKKLITPPISEGCLNGVLRKQIIALAKKTNNLEIIERPISVFELQKADELFLTNVIQGIQPITCYRKKTFEVSFANQMLEKLNELTNKLV